MFASNRQKLLYKEPDWAYFYLTNIAFILVLNQIHSFVLKFFNASSGCLAYARWETLDVSILCL